MRPASASTGSTPTAGELPFYAVHEYNGRHVRTGVHLDGRRIRVADREFTLGPEGQLPIDDLRGSGIECLVGKAILLLAQVRVGPEGRPLALPHLGSLYSPAAHGLSRRLEAAGLLPEPLHPILRVRLRLLDRMGDLRTTIQMPTHLVDAFGHDEVSSADFSANYRSVIGKARERLESLRDDRLREEWLTRTLPVETHAIAGLEARKRDVAQLDPKNPEIRILWKRIRQLRAARLNHLMSRISRDLQTLEMEYWDSRGGILPWCVALGGRGFYEHVLARAEVVEETHHAPTERTAESP